MDKAAEAFRTISEVALDLDVPKHVLRFWEGKFPQVKPMKRGGGRRYYRPDDVELLKGIRRLLYEEGYTIKGVQKVIRDHGLEFVKTTGAAGDAVVPSAASGMLATSDTAANDTALIGAAATDAAAMGATLSGAAAGDRPQAIASTVEPQTGDASVVRRRAAKPRLTPAVVDQPATSAEPGTAKRRTMSPPAVPTKSPRRQAASAKLQSPVPVEKPGKRATTRGKAMGTAMGTTSLPRSEPQPATVVALSLAQVKRLRQARRELEICLHLLASDASDDEFDMAQDG